jgi:hypothetical protein
MEILIKLSKWTDSSEVRVTVSSPDCSVADIFAEARRQLPHPVAKILQLSERSGSLLFLALDGEGPEPERLSETKPLSEYSQAGYSCTLWLM